MDKENLTRMEYSLMLPTSDFYKQFSGNYLLIYQEDTIIFKDIPNQYFKYDFVGIHFQLIIKDAFLGF